MRVMLDDEEEERRKTRISVLGYQLRESTIQAMKTEHHIRTPDFLRTPKATSISEETKVNGLEKKIKELASELNRERSKLKESREYIRFLQRQFLESRASCSQAAEELRLLAKHLHSTERKAGMGREIVQRCRQLGILLHASLASHDSLALGWPSPMRAECVTWTQQVVRLLDSFFELQDSSQSMDLTTRTSAASSTSNPTSTLARALFSPSDGECPHGGESGENDEDDESDEDAEVGRSFSTAGLQGRGSNQEVLPVTEFSSRAPVAPGMLEASQGRGRAMSAARIGRAAECRSAAGKGHASHAHACAMLVQTRLEAKVDTTIASLVDLREGLDWSKRRMQARLSALQKALEVRVAEERKRPHPDALLAAMHAERAKWEAQRGELAGQLEAMKAQLDKERGVREGRIELQTHLAQMLGDISAVLDEARMAAEGLESDVVVLHGEMERMGKCMCAKLQRVEEEMEDTKSLADRKTVQTLGQATQAQANLIEEGEMRKKLSGEFSSQLLKFELRVGVLERERDGLQGELAAGMRLVEDLDGQLVAAREARKKVCTQLVVEEERAKELEARVGGLEEQAGCLREQVRDRERVACGLKRSVDCLRADLSEAQSSARRQDRQSKAHIRHLEKQVKIAVAALCHLKDELERRKAGMRTRLACLSAKFESRVAGFRKIH